MGLSGSCRSMFEELLLWVWGPWSGYEAILYANDGSSKRLMRDFIWNMMFS